MGASAAHRTDTPASATVQPSPGSKRCMPIPPQPGDDILRFTNEPGMTHGSTWKPMATDDADTSAPSTDKPVATAYALGYLKALLVAVRG